MNNDFISINSENSSEVFFSNLENINRKISSGELAKAKAILNDDLIPSEIAHLLASMPPKQRQILWELIEPSKMAEVLSLLTEDVRVDIIAVLNPHELTKLISEFDFDDTVDLLQELPERIIETILLSMDSRDRQRVKTVLSYHEDSAGGLMNTDIVTVRPNITIDVVLRYFRRYKKLPNMTDTLWVVNRRDLFIGALSLTRILVEDPNTTVREIMETGIEPLFPNSPADAVANHFERLDLVSAPVIDEGGKLLGRVTIDDVVDLIRSRSDHSLMRGVGLDEDNDMFAPVTRSIRRRSLWLGINLLTAFIASGVIGLFETTIKQIVYLAILMPIVASMGGIAGTQVLTLVIRGMALGRIGRSNFKLLVAREFIIGVTNAFLWALAIAFCSYFWFQDIRLGYIIGLAVVINVTIATVTATVLPIYLKRINIDPALAGGVIVTTITDVVGFFSFLGIASCFYA